MVDPLITAYSDKCSEHGYLVQTVRETRDTQLAEVAEARAWRSATTEKLYGLSAAIQAHLGQHSARDQFEAEHSGEIKALSEASHRRQIAWAGWSIKALVALAGAAAALGIKLAFWG